MLSTCLSGLRQRMRATGVSVVDIRPGFVDTPMTQGFKKGALWATPAGIAPAVVKAIDKGAAVAYVPWFWRYIMWVIHHIPEPVFVRLRF